MSIPFKLSSLTRRLLLTPQRRHQSTATLLDKLSQRLGDGHEQQQQQQQQQHKVEADSTAKGEEEEKVEKVEDVLKLAMQTKIVSMREKRKQMIREQLVDPTPGSFDDVLIM